MKTLLKMNLRRWFQHPVFWAFWIFTLFFGIFLGLGAPTNNYIAFDPTFTLVPTILYMHAMMLTAMICMQHKNGTLRNKVIAGKRKGQIFLAELLAALAAAAAVWFALLAPVIGIAYPVIRNLPANRLAAACISLLASYLITAALSTLFGLVIRRQIPALLLCLLTMFVLVAAAQAIPNALKIPELFVNKLQYADPWEITDYRTERGEYNGKTAWIEKLYFPKDSGVHWNSDGILADKAGNPVDSTGNPLPADMQPTRKEREISGYVKEPLRSVLTVCDRFNPFRTIDCAGTQFLYETNETKSEELQKKNQAERDEAYAVIVSYLPWQLALVAMTGLAGWLLFRRKELL